MEAAQDFFGDCVIRFGIFITPLTSDAATTEMALVGESRIAEILANVLIPLFHGRRFRCPGLVCEITARLTNRRGSKPERRDSSVATRVAIAAAKAIALANKAAANLRRFLYAG